MGADTMEMREVVVARAFDAPRALVWRAWTEPERLARWFAPGTVSAAPVTVDLRPGGRFHFRHPLPDGREIWAMGLYHEVAEPERLVYTTTFADAAGNPVPPATYGMSDGHPAESLVTVTFAESAGRTTVTVRHALPAVFAEREGIREGWTEMLARLDGEMRGAR